jgi:hypothetical protein
MISDYRPRILSGGEQLEPNEPDCFTSDSTLGVYTNGSLGVIHTEGVCNFPSPDFVIFPSTDYGVSGVSLQIGAGSETGVKLT